MSINKQIAADIHIKADFEITDHGLFFRWMSDFHKEPARSWAANPRVFVYVDYKGKPTKLIFTLSLQGDTEARGFYPALLSTNDDSDNVFVPMITNEPMQTNYLQTTETDIERMMHEFRAQRPDRFIGVSGPNHYRVELNLKNGSMYFYGGNRDSATMRRNDFVLYCKEKGIDALSCTMIPEEKATGDIPVLPVKPNSTLFNSLSREQVNDLIAEKVMGWSIAISPLPKIIGEEERWYEFQGKMVAGRIPDRCGRPIFDPYHDLNDCWNAEHKLMVARGGRDTLRKYIYGVHIVGSSGGQIDLNPIYPDAEPFHLSAKQRCHCILKAIGEVE